MGIRSDRTSGSSVAAGISAHGYKLDDLGRRTRNTFQDGSYWEYGYNDRSEVTSATRKTSAGTVIPQMAASYSYDGIGNRLSSTSPVLGDHTYTPNSLNQYGSVTTGNSRTAIGRAPAAWNIEVDGVAAGRTGELYHRSVTASNGAAPVWKDVVTRRDTGAPSTTGHFWYAATPFSPIHDDDGNLTNDGRWSYVWNAENRLIQMESTPQAVTAGHPHTKVVNTYDWQGRRIAKHVWTGGTAASPVFSSSTRWLYNGWNEIAEFSASSDTAINLTRQNIFTWGLDLSGSLQGAGGVGGLLVQTTVASGVKEGASYDGNSNIVAWTKSTASVPTARREYDAFGNTIVSEGGWPSRCGFSTKIQDAETGLYYYEYRFFDPLTGRWISKDPIGEEGGVNLYGFVDNDGLNSIDATGLSKLIIKLTRKTTGWFAIYGDLDVTTDAPDILKCCGLPLHYKTLETPGKPLVGKGNYTSTFTEENYNNPTGRTSIKGKYNYGIDHNYWTQNQAHLPQKPANMSESEYNDVLNREYRTDGGNRNIHFGPTSSHSTGCVLIGDTYIYDYQTLSRNLSDRFDGSLQRDVPHLVPRFELQNTINSQFKLFSAISCAKKRGAQLSYVVVNNAPVKDPNIPNPVPMRPSQPGQIPRGVMVNDISIYPYN